MSLWIGFSFISAMELAFWAYKAIPRRCGRRILFCFLRCKGELLICEQPSVMKTQLEAGQKPAHVKGGSP